MPLTRRSAIGATLGAGLALASREALSAAAVGGKPNIIFILADDLGYADVSCYGRRDYQTPAIDRLAAEGLRFMQAYANSAVCSATRTGLMTGRYQDRIPVGLEEPLGVRDVGLPAAASDATVAAAQGRLRHHLARQVALGLAAKIWPPAERLRPFLGFP